MLSRDRRPKTVHRTGSPPLIAVTIMSNVRARRRKRRPGCSAFSNSGQTARRQTKSLPLTARDRCVVSRRVERHFVASCKPTARRTETGRQFDLRDRHLCRGKKTPAAPHDRLTGMMGIGFPTPTEAERRSYEMASVGLFLPYAHQYARKTIRCSVLFHGVGKRQEAICRLAQPRYGRLRYASKHKRIQRHHDWYKSLPLALAT